MRTSGRPRGEFRSAQHERTPMTAARKTRKPAESSRLSRDDWLDAAFQAVVEGGFDKVRVLGLAAALGVTRGSFYWHFKHRDELLRSMVDWWRDQQLSFLAALAARQVADPASQIKAVIDFTQHTEDSHHDVAMREFARFNKVAAQAVATVDQQRVDYLAGLFRAADFTEQEALLRARALYFYQVGEYTTSLAIDPGLRDELAERQFKLLICRPLDG